MPQTTSLNRPWLAKMVVFFALFLAFGIYGLYDATVTYPNRGRRYASYSEFQYLEAAKSAGRLSTREVSVEDPRADRARLRQQDPARAGPLDGARLAWLEALAVVGELDPRYTRVPRDDTRSKPPTPIPDADARYNQLKQAWTTASGGGKAAPKPLARFDIYVQWFIAAIGFVGALWLLVLFIRVARHRYGWDAQTQTLRLPGGHALTPADIEDFDKRKWDKFLIFVKVKPAHPTLGGQEIKLDLYRYHPLESWVLEMERTAFPERAAPAEPPAVPEPPGEASGAPAS